MAIFKTDEEKAAIKAEKAQKAAVKRAAAEKKKKASDTPVNEVDVTEIDATVVDDVVAEANAEVAGAADSDMLVEVGDEDKLLALRRRGFTKVGAEKALKHQKEVAEDQLRLEEETETEQLEEDVDQA